SPLCRPSSTLFLFDACRAPRPLHSFPTRRSSDLVHDAFGHFLVALVGALLLEHGVDEGGLAVVDVGDDRDIAQIMANGHAIPCRSEEHTSELQSRFDLVCRLLLEKKKRLNCSHLV